MADYSMTPRAGGVAHSDFSGAVIDGVGRFYHGLDPQIIDPTWFDVVVRALDAGVTNVVYTGLSTDKTYFTMTITGAGDLAVSATAIWSGIR